MKRRAFRIAAAAITGSVLVLAGQAGGATAAPSRPTFTGEAGAYQVNKGGTVLADLTAASTLACTTRVPGHVHNAAVDLNLPDVLRVAAVKSYETTSELSNGSRLVTVAKLAGVNLLHGLLKIGVVKTVSTTAVSGRHHSAKSFSRLVNVVIGGNRIPASVPPNYTVTIPGLISVTLNSSTSSVLEDGSTDTTGVGALVTLLAPAGNLDEGTKIYISATHAAMGC